MTRQEIADTLRSELERSTGTQWRFDEWSSDAAHFSFYGDNGRVLMHVSLNREVAQ